MRKIFLTLAAGALGLTLAGTAEARPGHRGHRERHEYRHSHAVRYARPYHPHFSRAQFHYTRRVWDARCHRWIYWEPQVQVYYYYDAPANCYVPVP